MNKTWMLKSLLLCAPLVLTACNEKIAPELADPATAVDDGTTTGTTTGGGGGGVTTTTNPYFALSLKNTPTGIAPELLGYTLHKANAIGSTPCQIDDIVDVPDTLNSTRDITCFLEAEEFSLYYNGFSVAPTASGAACSFVTTEPYSYYKFQPGVSARLDGSPRQVVKFNCTDQVKQSFGGTVVPTFGTNASTYTTVTQLCGKYFNIDEDNTPVNQIDFGLLNLSATAAPVSVSEDAKLCSFNYELSDASILKCDEGKVKVHTVSVDAVDSDADTILDTVTVISGSASTVSCGGKIRNCLGGPAREIMGEEKFQKGTKTLTFDLNASDEVVNSVMEVTRSFDRMTNYYMANFIRQCSGLPNFTTAANFNTTAISFNPDVMEDYVRLGTTQPGGGTVQEKDPNLDQMDVIILADDPFRAGIPDLTVAGMAANDPRRAWSTAKLRAVPFHTFTCLGSAMDVKAPIRLVVREWNRNFSPSTQEFRYISDVFSVSARMDAGSAQTNPYLSYDEYNDVWDWDDFLVFENSPTNSCTLVNMDSLIYPARSSNWFPREEE